jgi:hypothetical protein
MLHIVFSNTATPYWVGKLVAGDNQLTKGFAEDIQTSSTANNKAVILDPTGSGKNVIRVKYSEVRMNACAVILSSFVRVHCTDNAP